MDDLGTYDYNPLHEITIDTLKNRTIEIYHQLEVEPKISFSGKETPLEYCWYRYTNNDLEVDTLSLEEKLVYNNEQKVNLQKLNLSIMLAKQILEKSYDEMKNSVTPKFTENLSKNISKITNGKYSKVNFNEETGLVVELENGDNVLAEKLSVGTIDQLYLSLRLSMVDELSEEKIPILLDEAFAFYDNFRLENILKYLNDNYKNRQIIIFTCTDREKNILNKNK